MSAHEGKGMPRPREARREQVPTGVITARAIVRSPYFAAGVDEVRRGLPPRLDLPEADRDWAYERGRAWTIRVDDVRCVAHQPADIGIVALTIHRGNLAKGRQHGELVPV